MVAPGSLRLTRAWVACGRASPSPALRRVHPSATTAEGFRSRRSPIGDNSRGLSEQAFIGVGEHRTPALHTAARPLRSPVQRWSVVAPGRLRECAGRVSVVRCQSRLRHLDDMWANASQFQSKDILMRLPGLLPTIDKRLFCLLSMVSMDIVRIIGLFYGHQMMVPK